MSDWDFSKLPPEEHARVCDLIERNEWRELVDVHDTYKLSRNVFCCAIGLLKNEFLQAVKTGKINNGKNGQTP
jgi:molybdenum cofactor biosynthesis enzyme